MLWCLIVVICGVLAITLGVLYGIDMKDVKDGLVGTAGFLFFAALIAGVSAAILSGATWSSSDFKQIRVEDYEIVEDGNIRTDFGKLTINVRENGKIVEKKFDANAMTLTKKDGPPSVHVETFEWTARQIVPWSLGTQQYVTITSKDVVQITPK